MNTKEMMKIRNSEFGQWARDQKIDDLRSYMWNCMLYGPPKSEVWNVLYATAPTDMISEKTVDRAILALIRKAL